MVGPPRMPVVQKHCEFGAEVGRSGHHSLKQLLLEVSRQRRQQFDGCLPECHRCLGLVHMVISFRRKSTNLSFVPANAELRFPEIRT